MMGASASRALRLFAFMGGAAAGLSSGARGTWALGTGASSAVPCRAFISASGEARAADPASVVQVYSTVGCPYCMRAKKKLAELGVPYDEFDVTGDEALRSKIAKLTARSSVPQIFVGAVHVGGCDDLMAAVADGSLFSLLDVNGVDRQAPVAKPGPGTQLAGEWSLKELLPQEGILNHGQKLDAANWLSEPGAVDSGTRSSTELASSLQQHILRLYDEFVLADGSRVDYAQMVKSGRLHAYASLASELGDLSPSQLPSTEDGRLAFWLNLYNAIVVHANAVIGAPVHREGRTAFYAGNSGVAYKVAGFKLSLDDIEHAIVRGSPAGDPRAFAPTDPRASLILPRKFFDARIHFALNCGAKSCPPIKIYDSENLQRALALAAGAFCESTVLVDELRKTVTLSKLFEWYRVDFGDTDEEVLGRVLGFLEGTEAAAALERLLRHGTDIRVEYSEYDWGVNEVSPESKL